MDSESPTSRPAPNEPGFGPKVSIAGIIIGIAWVITFNGHPPQEGSVTARGSVVD